MPNVTFGFSFTCKKHHEINLQYMSIAGMKISYCWKCTDPKKKVYVGRKLPPRATQRFADKKAIEKEVWKGKESARITSLVPKSLQKKPKPAIFLHDSSGQANSLSALRIKYDRKRS